MRGLSFSGLVLLETARARASDNVAPHEEPWGYWGTCLDRYGSRWMFNVNNN